METEREETECISDENQTLDDFYITFGVNYGYDPHPRDDDVNPDGVFCIKAEDMESARNKAFDNLGIYWHQCLTYKEYLNVQHYFPKGVIKTL